jgi:serine/threonine protein kinase/tetratricopeptide (TPR) repeat protein
MNPKDPGLIAVHALKVPLHERTHFLSQACQSDSALRLKVEELIRAYEESGEFGDVGPKDNVPPTQGPKRREVRGPGTRLGNYKLLQQIGEGGFGVVYMAEQSEPVKRKVAVKVVKPGMDTREVIARFEAERQALALMDHPNIARVFDAGSTPSGHPYFVMELVRGVSVTEYCEKNKLSTRERLQLFTHICHAVQHAHDKGVIHRDLKPSNLMVTLHDGKPVPKVIDFGVAKALNRQLTEKTLFTAYGQMVGTPQYMSPEQAEMSGLGVDTRCDVYSLGVILYELLTGTTPLDQQRLRSAAYAEMIRMIQEEEPPKPSTRVGSTVSDATVVARHRNVDPRKLAQELRGELDWIVMKAIEKDRGQRYETANGLVADIESYLADAPIAACPPSLRYRFRKFARRNKALLATAAGLGLILVACAVLSTMMAVRAWNTHRLASRRLEAEGQALAEAEGARRDEASQRAAAERERDRARNAESSAKVALERALAAERESQSNFRMARQTVDQYLTTVSESQLLTVPGMQPLREDLIDSARRFYEQFVEDQQQDADLREGLALTYLRLGNLEREMRRSDRAQMYHAKAQKELESLIQRADRSRTRLRNLAEVYRQQGKFAPAVRLCNLVLQEDPQDRETQLLLASIYNSIGIDREDLAERIGIYRKAFAIRRGLVQLDPTNAEYLGDFSSTLNNVGVLLNRQGQRRRGLEMYQLAVKYVDQAFALAPYSMLYGRFAAISHRNIASSAANLGLEDEAERSYRAVADTWHTMAVNNPTIAEYKSERYRALQQMANYQRAIGQDEQAVRTLRRARQSIENLPQETAEDLYNVAKVYGVLAQSRGPERASMSRRAIKSLAQSLALEYLAPESLDKERSFDAVREHKDYARLVKALTLEESMRALERDASERFQVQQIRRELDPLRKDALTRVIVARALRNSGEFYVQVGELQAAEDTALSIVAALEKSPSDSIAFVELMRGRYLLGRIHFQAARFSGALDAWNQAWQHLEEFDTENATIMKFAHTQVGLEEARVADQLARLGALDLALQRYRQAVSTMQKSQQWFTATRAHLRYAWLLAAAGDAEGFAEEIQLMEKAFGQDVTGNGLAHMLVARGSVADEEVAWDELLARAQQLKQTGALWHQFALGLAYLRNGDWQAAIDTFELWHKQHGDVNWVPVSYYLSMAYHRSRDEANARRVFELAESHYRDRVRRAVAFDPLPYDLHDWRGEAAHLKLARREAWHVLRGAEPDGAWSHLIEARALAHLGLTAEAAERFAAAVAPQDPDRDLLLTRAQFHAQLGQHDDALADYQQLEQLNPDDPIVWIRQGRYFVEQGKSSEADEAFAHAAQLAPDKLHHFLQAGWWVAGPFGPKLADYLPPNLNPDPSRPVSRLSGTSVEPARVMWRTRTPDEMGWLDLHDDASENETLYLLTYVYSTDERTVTLRTNQKRDYRVWVNGQPALNIEPAFSGGFLARQFRFIPCVLRPGRNVVLVKLLGSSKHKRFALRLNDHPLERAFDFSRSGLLDDAGHIIATEYARSPAEEWRWLESKYDCLRHHTEMHHLISQDRQPENGWDFWSVAFGARHPEHQIPREVIGRLADESNTPDKLLASPWLRNHIAFLYVRADRPAEAVALLGDTSNEYGKSILALAHHHLGNAKAAQLLLGECLGFLESRARSADTREDCTFEASYFAQVSGLCRETSQSIHGNTSHVDQIFDQAQSTRRRVYESVEPATSAYDDLVVIAPTSPLALLARAQRLVELGRVDEAAGDIETAITLAPADVEVISRAAKFWAARGDVDRTRAAFQRAFEADRKGHNSWKQPSTSVAYRLMKYPDVFDQILEDAASLSPIERAVLWLARGRRQARIGDFAEAREAYERAFELRDRFFLHNTVTEYAALLLLTDDVEAYEEMLPRANERLHDAPLPLSRTVLLGSTNPDTAQRYSEHPELMDGAWESHAIALAHYRLGNFEEALRLATEQLKRPLRHSPKTWPILVMANHRLGHSEEAQLWCSKLQEWLQLMKDAEDWELEVFPDCMHPSEWLMAQVLYREAQQVLGEPAGAEPTVVSAADVQE